MLFTGLEIAYTDGSTHAQATVDPSKPQHAFNRLEPHFTTYLSLLSMPQAGIGCRLLDQGLLQTRNSSDGGSTHSKLGLLQQHQSHETRLNYSLKATNLILSSKPQHCTGDKR